MIKKKDVRLTKDGFEPRGNPMDMLVSPYLRDIDQPFSKESFVPKKGKKKGKKSC